MGYFIVFLAVFLLVFAGVLLFPIRLLVNYKKDEVENVTTLDIKYMFFTFRAYPSKKTKNNKQEKPKKNKEPFSFEKKKTEIEKYIRIFDAVKADVIKIMDYATSKAMVIEKIGINVEFGFEDAMHTGIFTGIINGFVYNILGIVHHKCVLQDMDVNIQPVFGNKCYKIQSQCIIKMKNVHIIIVAINVLKLMRKMKKI